MRISRTNYNKTAKRVPVRLYRNGVFRIHIATDAFTPRLARFSLTAFEIRHNVKPKQGKIIDPSLFTIDVLYALITESFSFDVKTITGFYGLYQR